MSKDSSWLPDFSSLPGLSSYYTSSPSSSTSESTSTSQATSTSPSMLETVWGSLPSAPSLLWSSTETIVTSSSTSLESPEFVPAGAVSSFNGKQPEVAATTTTNTVTITTGSSVSSSIAIAGVGVVAAAVAAPVSLPLAAGMAAVGAVGSVFNYFTGDSSNTTITTATENSAQLQRDLMAEIRAFQWKLKGAAGSDDSPENHDDSGVALHVYDSSLMGAGSSTFEE